MNVKELKNLIANMPDDAEVLIWVGLGEVGEKWEDVDKEAVSVQGDAHVTEDVEDGVYAVHLGAFIQSPV